MSAPCRNCGFSFAAHGPLGVCPGAASVNDSAYDPHAVSADIVTLVLPSTDVEKIAVALETLAAIDEGENVDADDLRLLAAVIRLACLVSGGSC